jgi:hypothetical protein
VRTGSQRLRWLRSVRNLPDGPELQRLWPVHHHLPVDVLDGSAVRDATGARLPRSELRDMHRPRGLRQRHQHVQVRSGDDLPSRTDLRDGPRRMRRDDSVRPLRESSRVQWHDLRLPGRNLRTPAELRHGHQRLRQLDQLRHLPEWTKLRRNQQVHLQPGHDLPGGASLRASTQWLRGLCSVWDVPHWPILQRDGAMHQQLYSDDLCSSG